MIASVERWYGCEWSVVFEGEHIRRFWSEDREKAETLAAAINDWWAGDKNPDELPYGFNGDGTIRRAKQDLI